MFKKYAYIDMPESMSWTQELDLARALHRSSVPFIAFTHFLDSPKEMLYFRIIEEENSDTDRPHEPIIGHEEANYDLISIVFVVRKRDEDHARMLMSMMGI